MFEIEIKAKIRGAAMKNVQYSFNIGGWQVSPEVLPMGMVCITKVNSEMSESALFATIDSLKNALLSLFITDFYPRKIIDFTFPLKGFSNPPTEEEQFIHKIGMIFGFPQSFSPTVEQIALDSFFSSGWIFNAEANDELTTLTDDKIIREWHTFFTQNPNIAKSASLIQESFGLTNKLNNNQSFFDSFALSSAIIFLVSGLESIFRKNETDHSDISFKFSYVGSVFYKLYVTDKFFSRFLGKTTKLDPLQFHMLLKVLYDIRSDIAHGSHSKVGKIETWRPIFDVFRVNPNIRDRVLLNRHIAFSLGLLQKHIIALLVQSRDNLNLGTKVFEKILL